MRINRENLLRDFRCLEAGLASGTGELIEQSSCFIMKNGTILTFNDEVCCRAKNPLGSKITGAVQAAPFIAVLDKLQDDEVKITLKDKELTISAKRRKADIRMDSEILLPVDSIIEDPSEWKLIHEDFIDAVSIVQECAGKITDLFMLTCIHIHPRWIEASDDYQIARYKLPTGVKESVLIKKESLKHVVTLGMTEFGETDNWLHFRNPNGLILSCRRYLETFKDVSGILDVKGTPTSLPKGLEEDATFAEIFSKENGSDDNVVQVEIKSNELKIKGSGASGKCEARSRITYTGKPISFVISPTLLVEIGKKHNEVLVSEDRIMVDGGKWRYVSCLGVIEEGSDPEEEEIEDE